MKRLLLVLSLAASAALAQNAPAPPFPDDFTPHPCAPADTCKSFPIAELKQAAFTFLGLRLDNVWLEKYSDEVAKSFTPICRKQATCLATPGNPWPFCNDAVVAEFRSRCDAKFDRKNDFANWEQCRMFVETYMLGIDQHTKANWETAQACAREKTPAAKKDVAPIVWFEPAVIPPDYGGYIRMFALDPETKVPLAADATIEDQIVYAPANPTGKLSTWYHFRWKPQYKRVPNAEGHTDLVAPNITIDFPYHRAVTIPMPTQVPKLIAELRPAADQLRPGKNTVTVHTRDAATGQPVETRVMIGGKAVADSNTPFVLEIKKGKKLPEIWVTSLFDRYSDVVVVKASAARP